VTSGWRFALCAGLFSATLGALASALVPGWWFLPVWGAVALASAVLLAWHHERILRAVARQRAVRSRR